LGTGAIVAIVIGAVVGLCLVLGAVVAVVSPASNKEAVTEQRTLATAESAKPSVGAGSESSSAGQQPAVEMRTVTETETIPFEAQTIDDPSLAAGTIEIRIRGVAGVKTLTFQVTLTNGVQTGKKLVGEVVTTAPITEVTANGTKAERQCDPNYAGACVPIASDVDCAGGSGNGPAYVEGPVKVIGSDIYDLDRDGDGYGCD
jgi:hypothetical protein